MLADVRVAYVIQCRTNGLFLTEELGFARSFRDAGRLHDPQEAVDTALDNLDPDDYEIHQFLVFDSGALVG